MWGGGVYQWIAFVATVLKAYYIFFYSIKTAYWYADMIQCTISILGFLNKALGILLNPIKETQSNYGESKLKRVNNKTKVGDIQRLQIVSNLQLSTEFVNSVL